MLEHAKQYLLQGPQPDFLFLVLGLFHQLLFVKYHLLRLGTGRRDFYCGFSSYSVSVLIPPPEC